ncbi:hypothetical protein [Litoreibacter roseus]|uniref:Uncharacterized protein n=1 Tax=Litoreibacter roseus TaxID=2601869 RepID=A0A6N6JFL1_9RHOB|nr:hypothetical protein [Litoreibacter roseus]GFE64924.1 hypothetical protein KIN_19980 [Litoreibacter roseus]
MIETLLISFTGLQLTLLLIVTVVGGLGIGLLAYSTSEVVIGWGVVIFIQFVLFWTSAHLDAVLYGYKAGIHGVNPIAYVLLHHAVQIAILSASFAAGRAYAFRNSQ